MIYCLQPFPEKRPLSATEVVLFQETDPARRIITEVAANIEGALGNFGKKLAATLLFHGEGRPPDYIIFGHEHGIPLLFDEDDGPQYIFGENALLKSPKRVRGVYIEKVTA